MSRGMTEMPTKWQLTKYKIKSLLCKECKYSSYYGLIMCRKHSHKSWVRWYRNKTLDEIKNEEYKINPSDYKNHDHLTFLDSVLIRWYQRKK